MIRVVPATPAHVARVANALRPIDRVEAEAFGTDAKTMLRRTLANADEAWTAFHDGAPFAMFGVSTVSLVEWTGRPWFVGSEKVLSCARQLLTGGPGFIDRWHDRFRYLENWVSADNAEAIRMLRRWGFVVESEPVEFGGVAFLPFRRDRCALIQ